MDTQNTVNLIHLTKWATHIDNAEKTFSTEKASTHLATKNHIASQRCNKRLQRQFSDVVFLAEIL